MGLTVSYITTKFNCKRYEELSYETLKEDIGEFVDLYNRVTKTEASFKEYVDSLNKQKEEAAVNESLFSYLFKKIYSTKLDKFYYK